MNKSNKQLIRFAVILTSAILSLIAVPSAPAKEPVYNGKPLSDWLCCSPPDEAQNAVRQMGTNAIPTSLDMLGMTEKTAKRVAAKLGSKTIQQEARREDFRIDDVQALAAEKGFGVLGTNAEPAIPRMLKLLENEETTSRAAEALALVGPKGFGALTNYLATGKMRGSVIVALGQRGGGDPKVITQILINALKNDPELADNAAMFLVGKDPAVAVPALIQALDDKGAATRQWAAYALGSYGPAAKDAAPKLLSLYTNHQDEAGLVFEALKKIDRDTTAKAEEFTVNSGPLGARAEYTRTLLKNGKELIAGGYINTKVLAITNRCLSKAELMDPKTGDWTETGEMNVARNNHTATLLNDGRVLVAGGDTKVRGFSSA
jgi:HEAT repeat protein